MINLRCIDAHTLPVTISPPFAPCAKAVIARSISPASRTSTGRNSTAPTRPCQTLDIAGADRIGDGRENDRKSAGRLQQGRHRVGAISHQAMVPERDQLHRIFTNKVRVGSTEARVDADVAAIDSAQLLQPL